ncbi:hypothetical protein BDA99DRAFT_521943 [Phascolomyces articulosus]|uniref:Uncharacterized protein n=1 Tax=Phascolomyces articulosus TaxID=60185 RepID=A0AAD5JRT1_9FUNG|nr:hypothetical protein BDA99DRAFT_521943 [Phascolomyces articulosus]
MDRLNNDAVGNIISHLHSWKDIFEFHRSNPNLYRKVLSHKCHLPWTIDHHNDRSCLLQNYMATTIATASLSESTIANLFVKLSEYHSINTLNITNCGVVSFRKAKLLISGIADFSRNLDIQLLQSQKSTFEKAKRRNVPPIEENEIKLVIQDRLLAPTPSPAHEQQFQHQGNINDTFQTLILVNTTVKKKREGNGFKKITKSFLYFVL